MPYLQRPWLPVKPILNILQINLCHGFQIFKSANPPIRIIPLICQILIRAELPILLRMPVVPKVTKIIVNGGVECVGDEKPGPDALVRPIWQVIRQFVPPFSQKLPRITQKIRKFFQIGRPPILNTCSNIHNILQGIILYISMFDKSVGNLDGVIDSGLVT